MDLLTIPFDKMSTRVQPQMAWTAPVRIGNGGSVMTAVSTNMIGSVDVPVVRLIPDVSNLQYVGVTGTSVLEGRTGGGRDILSGSSIGGPVGDYWSAYDPSSANAQVLIVHGTFTPPTEVHFFDRIMQAALPAKWIAQGVQPPTHTCRDLAYRVWQQLYKSYGILPVRVAASVDEGILLIYENTNGKTLSVEIYNDLEIAALVNQGKEVRYSEMIDDLSFGCVVLAFNV